MVEQKHIRTRVGNAQRERQSLDIYSLHGNCILAYDSINEINSQLDQYWFGGVKQILDCCVL